MSKETGGAAFPLPMGSETVEGCEGMQLRDYFAAKALPLINGNGSVDEYAKAAYDMADAMLRARGQ
ncbi:hypothetical protein HA41_00470 [Pantoea conspicua]|uniref:Uncharacterized protein n=1 Tax=Pantoea conspicua TaxID=472705 RepID=A0A1X1C2Q1_9GAMM|nr:hypothetical protein [Pantoea conspicua]ORM55940.1 hypothetical protein HA41_00470 [Pantoea conspicua]